MVIVATCRSCGQKYALPEEVAGTIRRCRRCGARIRIPALPVNYTSRFAARQLSQRSHWRRFPRYSFRTLLIIVGIICAAMSMYYPRSHVSARFKFGVTNAAYRETQMHMIRSEFVIVSALRAGRINQLPVLCEKADPVTWLRNELAATLDGDVLELRLEGRSWAGEQLHQIVDAVADAYLLEAEYHYSQSNSGAPGTLRPKFTDVMRIKD